MDLMRHETVQAHMITLLFITFVNKVHHLLHVSLLEAPGGDGRGTEPDAARVHRALVTGD